MKWQGVMPAITTCFDAALKLDAAFITDHSRWLVESGCTAIIPLGSLGEGATLEFEEKLEVIDACVKGAAGRAPVAPAISALRTPDAVKLAKAAADHGAQGMMVLPPYVYKGDWREMKAHVAAVLLATPQSAMLYNNPISYGTDFLPEQIAELAQEHENLHAVKESSADVRRITAIRALVGDRLQISAGVDDLILEAIGAGAVGWVAGLVNAMPRESVALFEYGTRGDRAKAFELYRWFLPLLRMDTVPKFVQLIKLVQQECGKGNARVRPPRLEVTGAELVEAREIIKRALVERPRLAAQA
ncbi:MAG: dihydrodipicolinate synthase family protein [Candidatus Acidiferrales bacterium]